MPMRQLLLPTHRCTASHHCIAALHPCASTHRMWPSNVLQAPRRTSHRLCARRRVAINCQNKTCCSHHSFRTHHAALNNGLEQEAQCVFHDDGGIDVNDKARRNLSPMRRTCVSDAARWHLRSRSSRPPRRLLCCSSRMFKGTANEVEVDILVLGRLHEYKTSCPPR